MASKYTRKEKALRTYLQGLFSNPDPSITIRQREKWRLELQALEKTINERKIARELAKARKLEEEEEVGESNEDDADDDELEEQEPVPTPKPAPPDPTKLPNLELCELFSKQKWFRDQMGVTDTTALIDACEAEIRRRKLPMYFTIEGTNQNVNEEGQPVPDLRNRVYMGTAPNPNPPEPEEEHTFTPTPSSLQSAYWNRGKAKPV